MSDLARRVLIVALVLVVSSCGHRIDNAELLLANGEVAGAAGSSGSISAPGARSSAGSAASSGAGEVIDGGASPSSAPRAPGAAASPSPGDAVSAGTATCSTPNESGPISIGSVGNYSGPAGSALAAMAKGLQIWAAWVNGHGGLCGRQVQVIVVDDHSDPAQHRAALQDLVENRHVVAFSNAATLTAEAAIPYIESVRVPVIGTACANEPEFASSMYFLACAHPADLTFGTAKNAALFGPASHRLAITTCRETAACGSQIQDELVNKGGAEEAGMTLVSSSQSSIAQPDYTSECQAAKGSGAEVFGVFLDPASMRRLGRSCSRQGYAPVFTQVAATVDAALPTEPGLGNMLLVAPTFSFVDSSTPAEQEFQEAMASLYGAAPGPTESHGWAHGKLIERAATLAAEATGSITPASLVDALHTLHDETLGGLIVPISYPAGGPGTYPACWFAMRATDGTWSTLNGGQPVCR